MAAEAATEASTSLIDWVVAAGVGAIIIEILRAVFQRKKMGADAAKTITDAATVLLGPLQDRIKDLERVIEETKKELDATREELHTLRAKVAEAGLNLDL